MDPLAIQWKPYPEEIRETPLGQIDVVVHRPDSHHVVMGAGGRAEKEVFASCLNEEGIPLFKRKGGGGTVLLGPETLVVTIHAGVEHLYRNLAYFQGINEALMTVFRNWKTLDFAQKGISDIAVDDRKIVGTSIFRRRQYLLFQASILVELDLERMTRLLKPPPREPDYRRGRDHGAFVTCLRDLGITLSSEAMMNDLQTLLPGFLRRELDKIDKTPPLS